MTCSLAVIHQDFVNSTFGRHWRRGRSRPQIPLWDDKQLSKPQLSILWLSYINVPAVSTVLLLSSCCCCCCLFSQAFSSWTNSDPHHSGFKFQTVVCTLCIMCDVPSIAVFCSESTECFPGMASKFFLKMFVNIPVPGIILHFRLHIHCISIHKILYFSFFPPHFCTTLLCEGIATPVSMHVFSFIFNYVWPFCCNFSVCVYHLCVISMPRALHIE